MFTSRPPARDAKQFHHAAPTRSIHAISCAATLSFQGSGTARISAISVIPGGGRRPIPSPGPDRALLGAAAQSADGRDQPALAGRPAQRRNTPTRGNGSVARYKVIHAASRMIANRRFAMRRQTAQAGASGQEAAPEGADLRQVVAGDPHPGACVFHVRQSGVLSPSAITRCTKLRNPNSRPGTSPARQDRPSGRSWPNPERPLWSVQRRQADVRPLDFSRAGSGQSGRRRVAASR
jgi:hypothetical protein